MLGCALNFFRKRISRDVSLAEIVSGRGDDIFKTALPLFEEILGRICAFYSNFARNIHAIDEFQIPHLTIFGSIECPNTAEYGIWGAYWSALNMVKWGIPEDILHNAVQTCWSKGRFHEKNAKN